MNYNHSKPYIPPPPSPPALPRFTLPNEGSEEALDPLDVAATAQRPAVDSGRARRVVRRARTAASPPLGLRADATSEVQVEDILLEVYTEEPPPPTRRSAGVPALPASAERARAHGAAVDALLHASDAAFLPFGGHAPQPLRPAPQGVESSRDTEWPSVAPVAFPSTNMRLSEPTSAPLPAGARAVAHASPAGARRSRGGVVAIWAVALLLATAAGSVGGAIGLRDYARLREGAKAAAARVWSKPSARTPKQDPKPAAAFAAPLASPLAAPAPPAPPVPAGAAGDVAVATTVPAPLPSVSVESLPQPTIAADSSLVTFSVSAPGRRVFFDGRPMAVTGAPMTLRCGRHMIRIGSTGKARVTDLACGREVTLAR